MKDLRIVFMGTPDFAIESLRILVEKGYNIVGVITSPDRPKGRGQQVSMSAIKIYAQSQGLNVLQPTNLRDPEFIQTLQSLQVNLQVVVAFRMLPEIVWNMPEFGTFNLHASILPDYRGAAPINWALMNGEKETGVTTFFLQHAIDTGPIVYQATVPIGVSDDAGVLHDNLMTKGAELVLKTVQGVENNTLVPITQENRPGLHEAPKIHKVTCKIDWSRKTQQLFNFIRGLSPFPGAWTDWDELKMVKIFRVSIPKAFPKFEDSAAPGQVRSDGNHSLFAKTGDGWLKVEELQIPGRKRMPASDFLKGHKIP